jgi:hypothetical protein
MRKCSRSPELDYAAEHDDMPHIPEKLMAVQKTCAPSFADGGAGLDRYETPERIVKDVRLSGGDGDGDGESDSIHGILNPWVHCSLLMIPRSHRILQCDL